jgi:hypothetical protein
MTMHEEVRAGVWKKVEAGVMTKEQAEAALAMAGPEWIPPIVVYLATDEAANINGQVFHAEGNRIGIYSEPLEVRAIYKSERKFATEELIELVPRTLLVGYVNPAPPQPPK